MKSIGVQFVYLKLYENISGRFGAGPCIDYMDKDHNILVSDIEIINNFAEHGGGGMELWDAKNITLQNIFF